VFGSRVRFLVSGGAPISPELLEFFHAIGVLILEGYGLTETSAPATVNQPEDFCFGTVGRALPDVELRIAEDGEILIRGPGNFREYYKDPAATAEAFTEDGFFKSGDIGELDARGFLRITDRKKNIIVTAGGKNIAPQNIENLIKTDPRISQVMVYGDRRPYLVALVTLDEEEMAAWAAAHGRTGASLAELAADPRVESLVQDIVTQKNATLARYETVKKLRVLPEDFTVDNDMLTPTLKLKRRAILAKYGHLIEQMYDG
jgi:long-chain acyl-CoA synthetase